jgi:hypothetical protein
MIGTKKNIPNFDTSDGPNDARVPGITLLLEAEFLCLQFLKGFHINAEGIICSLGFLCATGFGTKAFRFGIFNSLWRRRRPRPRPLYVLVRLAILLCIQSNMHRIVED